MERKWFEKLLLQSIVFIAFLFALFVALRLVFILYSGVYHQYLGDVKSFSEYFNAFVNGLRYDSRSIAVLSIVYFVLGLAFFWTSFRYAMLRFYAFVVIFAVAFIYMAEIVFFEIYDDVFNANLLGLLFDDRAAIFRTGISGQYRIMSKVFIWLVIGFMFFWIYHRLFGNIQHKYGYDPLSSIRSRGKDSKIPICIFGFIFILSTMFCINSTIGFKGISLDRDFKPVENPFLRKITPGAFRDLYLVYRGYKRILDSHFSDYIQQSPSEVVKEYFHIQTADDVMADEILESYDLRDLLAREVRNESNVEIKHIFYIVAESLSEWHFDDEFNDIELTSGLKSLLGDGHGVKIDIFLENAGSTIKSMDVHLTGLLQTEIQPNTMLGNLKPFITAPAVIMKDLGYTNTFYYGGSGIWQKFDQYSASQGFDRIFYNTHIIDNAKIHNYAPPYEGTWGAFDHYLFDLVHSNVLKESQTKSFNMILTTSNHPPFDVPLEQFSVPLESIDNFINLHPHLKIKDRRFFGHIWYQDKAITRFIRDVSSILPDSLFIITGDHYDREYPKLNSNRKINNSIPLIMYSPTLEMKKIANIGSHIDIMPSIMEIVAPDGYVFHSFGTPLVNNKDIALSEKNYALGYNHIATERFIYSEDTLGEGSIEYFAEGIMQHNDEQLAKSLYKRLKQATALSWWILTQGYEVPLTPPPPVKNGILGF